MRHWLALGCTAALIAIAACNRGEEAPAPSAEEQAQAAQNVAQGDASPQDIAAVMHARHEHYEEMGKAMKAIGDQLKSSNPSLPLIRQHAALIAEYGPQVLTWFPEGSGPETGRETRAKAEIWSDPDTFRQRAQAFEAEATAFQRVAQTNDVAAIRAAQANLGNTCKNCHDRFRAPEED